MTRGLKPWFFVWAALGVTVAIFVGCAASSTSATISAAAGFDAASLFNGKCAKCHGRDGRSNTTRGRRTRSRDLTKAGWQDDVSDERIFNSISNGKGKMPAFRKSLSESQMDSLVTHIRRLRR